MQRQNNNGEKRMLARISTKKKDFVEWKRFNNDGSRIYFTQNLDFERKTSMLKAMTRWIVGKFPSVTLSQCKWIISSHKWRNLFSFAFVISQTNKTKHKKNYSNFNCFGWTFWWQVLNAKVKVENEQQNARLHYLYEFNSFERKISHQMWVIVHRSVFILCACTVYTVKSFKAFKMINCKLFLGF